jgi:hypothetical protein
MEIKLASVKWLFNAKGLPIAFAFGGYAFLSDGDLLGKIVGKEIWNVHYVGEIFDGNRLVRRLYRPLGSMEELAGWAAPPMPLAPDPVEEVQLPSEMHELDMGLFLKRIPNSSVSIL